MSLAMSLHLPASVLDKAPINIIAFAYHRYKEQNKKYVPKYGSHFPASYLGVLHRSVCYIIRSCILEFTATLIYMLNIYGIYCHFYRYGK